MDEAEVEEKQEEEVVVSREEQLEEQLNQVTDKNTRLLAEMENTRKRLQKERESLTQYAVERIIKEFLHPLDQLENALGFAEQSSDEVKNWAIGFEMILGQFKEVLSQHGITAFEAKIGEHFDPHQHEAVDTEETDEHPEGTILKQFVRGYRMGERTIRPAQVKVAKHIKQHTQGDEDEQEEEQ